YISCLSFFNAPTTTHIYTLSLHDALPISSALEGYAKTIHITSPPPELYSIDQRSSAGLAVDMDNDAGSGSAVAGHYRHHYPYPRSEEHTSELQSLAYLVCRLLLEKKK